MKSLEQHAFELDLHGFTVIENVLNAAEVSELRVCTRRLAEEVGTEATFGGPARHVANLVARDRSYWPLIDHTRVLPVVEAVLGPQLILGSLNSRIVRPGDREQALHSDIPAEFRKAGRPIMANTVWLLDDFTLANGATRVVPGSHLSPIESPPADREILFVHQAVARAGSVLVFNGQLWHGGGANRTDRERVGLFGHYRIGAGGWMDFQNDPHEGFPAEAWSTLNPRQKALLRMTGGVRPRVEAVTA
ncbi:MAG: hypothetical protein AMXMBFR7_26120 [Planctomycetota bacterium]